MSDDFKRLYRSQTDARLAGICGGLGVYLGIDPVVVRLLWVGVTCLTGFAPGILAYVIAWFIVPPEPVTVHRAQPAEPTRESTT
jgi:phage shock protein PspC (stress-responsive transcriptional regulator)